MAEISFHCSNCQQKLEAPEEMAGENVQCPSCESMITIPAQKTREAVKLNDISIGGENVVEESKQNTEDQSPAEAANTCPNCHVSMPENAVLCVQCGFHQKLGKVIETDLS